MAKIFKYSIRIADQQEIEMPKGARILCVQYQEGLPFLWAVVDSSEPPVKKKILIFGTGNEMGNHRGVSYIGTIQDVDRGYVWHVFEERN